MGIASDGIAPEAEALAPALSIPRRQERALTLPPPIVLSAMCIIEGNDDACLAHRRDQRDRTRAPRRCAGPRTRDRRSAAAGAIGGTQPGRSVLGRGRLSRQAPHAAYFGQG